MKKFSRTRKIMVLLGGISILVLLVGYLVMDYATTFMLKSITPKNNIQPEGKENSIQINADKDKNNNANTSTVADPTVDNKNTPNESSVNKELIPQLNEEPLTQTSQLNNEQPKEVKTNQQEADKDIKLKYAAEISTSKAEKVQEDISLKEKALVVSTMLKKLSPGDLALLSNLMSGGLTIEKKKEAKKLILGKLSEDEYNQLIEIAAKYGLSQGKKYSASKKKEHLN